MNIIKWFAGLFQKNKGGEIEDKSYQEDKSTQGETSNEHESTNDASMVHSDNLDGIVDDDEKKSIALHSRAKDHDIDDDMRTKTEYKGKGLENKTKLFVHSSWLAVHSSYFRALFYSGIKETHSKEVVMKIHQSELLAHLILIEAIYKLDVLDDKECSLVVEVLTLADKYDVNLVFKKCKYVLISTSISLKDCDYILKMTSDIPECGDIHDAMEKFLVKAFTPLDTTWLSPNFYMVLSEKSLKLLLGSDNLVVESENTVFIALMRWIGWHLGEIDDEHSLLSLVRFELMSVGFMYDIVRHHAIAKKLTGFNEFLQNGLAYHAFSPSRLDELEIKPVSRCSYRNYHPTFSWVIDQDEQTKLIKLGAIHSRVFWCKGYSLNFNLRYEETTHKRYSLFLFVKNMQNKGHVRISWKAESDLFADVRCKIHTYTSSSKGSGQRNILCNIAPCIEPNTLSHTIDVWVHIT